MLHGPLLAGVPLLAPLLSSAPPIIWERMSLMAGSWDRGEPAHIKIGRPREKASSSASSKNLINNNSKCSHARMPSAQASRRGGLPGTLGKQGRSSSSMFLWISQKSKDENKTKQNKAFYTHINSPLTRRGKKTHCFKCISKRFGRRVESARQIWTLKVYSPHCSEKLMGC